MKTTQALHIDKINSNGYFEEPLGQVKLLDHYHNFLFYVNISRLEMGYQTLVVNFVGLKGIENRDNYTNQLLDRLNTNVDQIEEQLNKLNYRRRYKKGLINGLGTVIKFISGNPDDNDLQTINENIQTLHTKQNANIERINQLTSFANQITKRLEVQAQIVNKNVENTKKFLEKMKNTDDVRLIIQNEIYQSENLLKTLLMIERTISLSLNSIPNLEIVSVKEIRDIQGYLQQAYNPQQLLLFDHTHLYRLLENTKLLAVGTTHTIAFLLKVPILKPFVANYSKIYPIPNNHDVILTPPKQYLLKVNGINRWTNEDCSVIDSSKFCAQQPTDDKCTIEDLNNCLTVKAINNYEIVHALSNGQLLTSFKQLYEIIEDCQGLFRRTKIQGSNVIDSPCKVIVGTSVYLNTTPTFEISTQVPQKLELGTPSQEINLQLRHLTSPNDLLQEVNQLQARPLTAGDLVKQTTHYFISTLSLAGMIIAGYYIIKYRRRIQELLCKPRKIIRLQVDHAENTTADEDVRT